ncbi:MAG: FdtA/QdtA family cupin domain-containing protein [Bacteroidales bacterium]|nr:FdtA/QdtA family cupin domain-containing protein [Bacteroidales bacterium]
MSEIAQIISLPKVEDPRGNLSFIEYGPGGRCPFEIERVYWVYDVPAGRVRHGRALCNTREMIVAMSGSFVVRLDDGRGNRQTVNLTRSDTGVVVEPGTWRELTDFSTNSVAMVLASAPYDADEYIEDYRQFTDSRL